MVVIEMMIIQYVSVFNDEVSSYGNRNDDNDVSV